jgi:hypothetical protein
MSDVKQPAAIQVTRADFSPVLWAVLFFPFLVGLNNVLYVGYQIEKLNIHGERKSYSF